MSGLLALIKRAAVEAVEQSRPMDYATGTVESISPMAVRINQQMPLPREHLILLLDQAGTFQPGDKVALLRVNKGQKYLILGKVV